MKKKALTLLKILIPLAIGIYIIWYFYNALTEEDKKQVFIAFKSANYFWILLSVFFGFLTFVIRAHRWRYLLKPMGYNVSFKPCYHSVMFGYLLNMIIPRAGEAGRAGVLFKKRKVPFEKGFGTIIAERAIDMFILGIIAVITFAYQWKNIDLIEERLSIYQSEESNGSSSNLGWFLMGAFLLLVITFAFLLIKKPQLKNKIKSIFFGFWEGIVSIKKTDRLGAFIFYSLMIWALYILMFWVCFYSLEETKNIDFGGTMAAFIAGTIGIIFVQGGISVFPALVGIVVTTYLYTDFEQPIHPVGFALGWIIWMSQTLLIVFLGLISLVWVQNKKNND